MWKQLVWASCRFRVFHEKWSLTYRRYRFILVCCIEVSRKGLKTMIDKKWARISTGPSRGNAPEPVTASRNLSFFFLLFLLRNLEGQSGSLLRWRSRDGGARAWRGDGERERDGLREGVVNNKETLFFIPLPPSFAEEEDSARGQSRGLILWFKSWPSYPLEEKPGTASFKLFSNFGTLWTPTLHHCKSSRRNRTKRNLQKKSSNDSDCRLERLHHVWSRVHQNSWYDQEYIRTRVCNTTHWGLARRNSSNVTSGGTY